MGKEKLDPVRTALEQEQTRLRLELEAHPSGSKKRKKVESRLKTVTDFLTNMDSGKNQA